MTKALPLPCVSTVFLSKTVPFHAVLHNTQEDPLDPAYPPGPPIDPEVCTAVHGTVVLLLCSHCVRLRV
eukprot:SAG22_NODE_2393_length_2622_cov_2.419738_4_plen_69_part_00